MKKSLIIATALLGLVACTNDEEIYQYTPDPAEKFFGKWQLISMEGQTEFDFNGDGELNRDLMIETNCYQDEFMEIFVNYLGKFTSNSYADIVVFPDFPNSDPESITCVDDFDEMDFMYAASGNQITIIDTDSISYMGSYSNDTITFSLPLGQKYYDANDSIIFQEDLILKYIKIDTP